MAGIDSAMSRQNQDIDLIRITHYINPHNFWFKHESAYLFNAEEQEFQLELIEFCETTFGRGNITTGVYKPSQQGELVAVFYFQLGRWIRAVIDDIQQDLGGQVICNLWAIDEGVPIKTSCRYIKPLPVKFAKMPSSVKHGGLEGILPAESNYNYLEGRSVHKVVENWGSGVVRVFQSLIEDAVSMKFCNLHHYQVQGVDIHFGAIKITSHQNVTNDAVDLLKKAGGKMVMVVAKDEFYKKFPVLRTLEMRRSEDNEHRENMKYHTNTFRPEYSTTVGAFESERKRFQDKYLIEQAREKFFEWDKRNTASSTVQSSNVLLEDFVPDNSQLNKPLVPPLVTYSAMKSKPRRRYDLEYKTLNDEETDSDEEEHTSMQRRQPPKWNKIAQSNNSNPRSGLPFERPQNSIYDKSLADVAPALHTIKLRRRAAPHKEPEQTYASKVPANGNPPAINIMPAGFCLGNVQFSNGNVILGSSEVNAGRRNNPFVPKPRAVVNHRKSQQQRFGDQDFSFEEEMIRKLDLGGGMKAAVDDDEQW